MSEAERKCTACGGSELSEGLITGFVTGFMPTKASFFEKMSPTPTRARACLACGHVDLYLNDAELHRIQTIEAKHSDN